MARVLPWLICAATLLLASIKSSTALRMAKRGCRETCGNLTIPYPFGIGPGCFYREGLDVSCENNTVYMHNSTSQMQIYNISLLGGQARVNTLIASKCFYSNGSSDTGVWTSFSTDVFTISSKANMLTAVGCNTLAFLGGYNNNGKALGVGCYSMCADKSSVGDPGGQCSGMGCCQTSITPNLSYTILTFDDRYNNSEVRSFNPCSYAFVAEQDSFRFEPSYLEDNKFTQEYFKDGVPTVLDWVVGTESCDEAVRNMSSYACISKNSHCTMSPNATGYLCACNDGFAGNPYLEEGCQDIDECSSPDQYPCHGICSNTIGDYSCSCESGTRSIDPKRETCNPIATFTKPFIGLLVGLAVGGGISLICLVPGIIIFIQKLKARQAKRLRAKYFKLNRGLLLQQLVDKDIAERMIFSLEELEKATNKFDEARKLGGGGHGTVYKGILSNQDVVAIKKSKITIQREIEEFINEVAILSQINHRNVVRLFGCSLETQVPLLVYEFISNGTLSDYLHVEGPISLSWGDRLRIALETASALAYLHSSALTSIIHRDVKSDNILLDHHLIAKVSDFGASRGIPIDQTGVTTAIQGTFGYLDPEYYQTSRLTDKSDVYSFGVILVELITRKKPSAFMHSKGVSLIAQFNLVISQDKLCEILDPQVISECLEGAKEVAALASTCLNLKGEERPTMRQVEMALEMLLVANKSTGQGRSAELNCTPAQISNNNNDNSRQYSTEQELLLSASFPR